MRDDYELISGIETHVELMCENKIFCGCRTSFGEKPNTHTCPVCLGLPGSLPVLNHDVVKLAIKAGLALNCEINLKSRMDRKNYTYPDLPKAYQISQLDFPLCKNGYVMLDSGKRIGITRIHIEEDAGKLIHEGDNTFIDYNRAGVPLIEIVSEPDIRSAEEAKEYAEKLRLIMRYADISDCKMQEGSMRCDVNLSVRLKGETELRTRTEIKNIGSFSGIARAVELEADRQCALYENNEPVRMETLRFDENEDKLKLMRVKETADDYRFFPEPDIPGFEVQKSFVEEMKRNLPELPEEKKKRYETELMLSKETVSQIIRYKKVCAYFEKVLGFGATPKNTANLMVGSLFASLKTDAEKEEFDVKVKAEELAKLAKYLDDKKINMQKAKETLLTMNETGKSVSDLISENDLQCLSEDDLYAICVQAVRDNPRACDDIRSGKDKAVNVIIGTVMKLSKGKARSDSASKIIKSLL